MAPSGRDGLPHSPRQAGGDAEEVHDVAGVAVLAKDHLQDRRDSPWEGQGRATGFHDVRASSFLSDPTLQVYFKRKKCHRGHWDVTHTLFHLVPLRQVVTNFIFLFTEKGCEKQRYHPRKHPCR